MLESLSAEIAAIWLFVITRVDVEHRRSGLPY